MFVFCGNYVVAKLYAFSRSVRADMYDQLLRQKTNVQKGISASRSFCGLCRQHLAKQMDSIVFQCGHCYHVACLEKAGCLFLIGVSQREDPSKPVDEQWHCYNCVTKNIVRVLSPEIDVTQTTSELHSQESVTRRDVVDEITNQRVSRAKDYQSLYKTPRSYLAILDLMGHPATSTSKVPDFVVTRHTSVFDLPNFNLKLAPDPPDSHL
jgi:hypothetical protein